MNEIRGLINATTGSEIPDADARYILVSPSGAPTTTNIITPTSNIVPLTIRGFSGQTVNLEEWQNSSGTVLASISANGWFGIGGTPSTKLTVIDTSTSSLRGILSIQYSTDTMGSRVGFAKARGTPTASTTLVTGDTIGRLMFRGYDGTNFLEMASIEAVSTGTIGTNRIPTYITFQTGTDAATSVLTEAMRITQAQKVGINTSVPTATLSISANSASTVGLITQGAPSQTANLTEWKNSSGTVLASVSTTGKITSEENAIISYVTNDGYGVTVGGYNAGKTNWRNAILGYRALETAGSGDCIAIGYFALQKNTVDRNTAVGAYALQNSATPFDNTAIGSTAGQNLTSGSYNVIVGSAAVSIATMDNSVIIGAGANPNATGQTNQIVIGYNATGAGSNSVTIGNTNITQTILRGTATITAPAAGSTGLIVNGAVAQSANLTEWKNSSGIVLASISANGSFTTNGNVTIAGDLTVNGTTVTVNTETVLIEDNIIELNSNLMGAPLNFLNAGIKVNRGTLDDYYFIWREADTTFRIGTDTTAEPALSGSGDSTQAVATREDNPTPDRGIAVWNNTARRFDTISASVAISGAINGTTNYLPKFTGTGTLGNSNIIDSGTGITTLVPITAQSNTIESVPLTVQGYSGQTANLTEWKNSSGTTLSSVTSGGIVQTPRTIVTPISAAGLSPVNSDIISWENNTMGIVLANDRVYMTFKRNDVGYFVEMSAI